MVFEFISEGPKGQIPKLIKFSETTLKGFYNGRISNCRFAMLLVGGGDTAHGGLPRLVSPPTGDNLKCTLYNLAFGDKNNETGDIDDAVVSNNGDSEQVLATVVWAVYAFTAVENDVWVYATGSTKSRTRLYRMGITKYIDEVKQDFLVFGLRNGEWENFEPAVEYTAFVVRR